MFQDHSVGVNISVVSEDGHEWVLVWDAAKVAGEDIRYQEALELKKVKLLPQLFKRFKKNKIKPSNSYWKTNQYWSLIKIQVV